MQGADGSTISVEHNGGALRFKSVRPESCQGKSRLFRQLPENFKIGLPLPEKSLGAHGVTRPTFGLRGWLPRFPTKPRFVHGCELLAV